MTTDTVPKAASRRTMIDGRPVTVTGIAKGAGMIRPNMATMLGFIATDAAIAPALLRALTAQVADASFNRITVDGDTSTNDSLILIATGAAARAGSQCRRCRTDAALLRRYRRVSRASWRRLSCATARARPSSSRSWSKAARTADEARASPTAIAHSPLVKTAFFASDPNLGRILAAMGYAGIDDLDSRRVEL